MRRNSIFLLTGVALTVCISSPARTQELLTLEDAITIGLDNSYSIRIARNNVQIAVNNNSYGHAGFHPRVDANVNQTNAFHERYVEEADGESTSQSGYPTHSLTPGVQLSWTLFDGFAMFARKERLELLTSQSEVTLRMQMENTITDIAYTYYTIVLNEELHRIYGEQLELSQMRLRVAREKALIGVGHEVQSLQAEVDFRMDSAIYIQQSNRVLNLKADLNLLLNRPPDTDFLVTNTIPLPTPKEPTEIYQVILESNPSLVYARIQTHISEVELREARSARYPSVSLSGAYNYSRVGTPEGQVVRSITHGPLVGVGASITLFNGMNASRRINNAKIISENQQLSQQELWVRLQSIGYKLTNELNQALELVRVEEKSVVLAQRNADVAWERYQLGAISDLELRESQNRLLDAHIRLITAQRNALVSSIEIKALMGSMQGYFTL